MQSQKKNKKTKKITICMHENIVTTKLKNQTKKQRNKDANTANLTPKTQKNRNENTKKTENRHVTQKKKADIFSSDVSIFFLCVSCFPLFLCVFLNIFSSLTCFCF